MKIDDNLRAAIRSTCKISQRPNRQSTREQYHEAVMKFIAKSPKLWERRIKALKKASDASAKARDKVNQLAEDFEKVGLNPWNPEIQIQNTELFVKAGGELPTTAIIKDADTIIAKLAAATPEEGAAIIKELGINWE